VAAVRHEILHVFTDRDIAIVEFDVHYTRHDNNVVTRAERASGPCRSGCSWRSRRRTPRPI
jgi:hypothetical protein